MDQYLDQPDDLDLLAQQAALDFAPAYPSWLYRYDKTTGQRVLKPPKTPKAGTFTEWAGHDHNDYSILLLRFIADLKFYRQQDAGVFNTFQPDTQQSFFSVEPTTQVNKLCTMVGGIPPRVSWPFKTEKERKDAQAAEDWAYHLIDQWGMIHRRQGNTDLRWDVVFMLGIYGRVIARVLPDENDPNFPWQIDLVDPATCFPVFGDKYGLLRMTRVYRDTIGRVLDGLDPNGERGLNRKLSVHYNGKGTSEPLDLQRQCTVNEVWTRWSCYISVDSVEVLRYDHEFGKVPFVYLIGPGEAGMTSTPALEGIPSSTDWRERDAISFSGITTRQMDIARKGLSFFHGFRGAIRYEEILYGILLTMVELDVNPPQITESGYQDDPSPVDMRPGGHTKRRPGEKTNPVQTQVRAQVVGPLINELRSARQKAGLPDNVFGLVEGSNVTGFAENTLLAATKDRVQPYIDGVAAFFADCIEMAAYLYHGFGHLYVDNPATGEYRVPSRARNPYPGGEMPQPAPMAMMPQNPMMGGMGQMGGMPGMSAGMMAGQAPPMPGPPHVDDPFVAITRETFDLVGFRPKVELESFDWNAMSQRANVAQMLLQGEVWSKYTARDKLGVDNPDQEGRWINVEKAMGSPMIQGIQIQQAAWETGNMDLYQQVSQQIAMQQQQAQPQPGQPNGGSVRGVQTVQGDSQPSVEPTRGPGRPGGPQGEDVGP